MRDTLRRAGVTIAALAVLSLAQVVIAGPFITGAWWLEGPHHGSQTLAHYLIVRGLVIFGLAELAVALGWVAWLNEPY